LAESWRTSAARSKGMARCSAVAIAENKESLSRQVTMALLTSSRTRCLSSESRSSLVRDSTRSCRFAVNPCRDNARRRISISDMVEVARTRRIPISSSVQS
jgi:hypothetical protein